MKQNVQISNTLLIWENILPSDLSTGYGKHGAISDYSNHPWMGTGLHAVAPAVDDPLSAVQNAPHICLYLFASGSAGYSADPFPDLISADHGRFLRIEVHELSDTRVCKEY